MEQDEVGEELEEAVNEYIQKYRTTSGLSKITIEAYSDYAGHEPEDSSNQMSGEQKAQANQSDEDKPSYEERSGQQTKEEHKEQREEERKEAEEYNAHVDVEVSNLNTEIRNLEDAFTSEYKQELEDIQIEDQCGYLSSYAPYITTSASYNAEYANANPLSDDEYEQLAQIWNDWVQNFNWFKATYGADYCPTCDAFYTSVLTNGKIAEPRKGTKYQELQQNIENIKKQQSDLENSKKEVTVDANSARPVSFQDPKAEFPQAGSKTDTNTEGSGNVNSTQEYGKVQTIQTESGHKIILNDSNNNIDITILHASGSKIQINNLGDINIYSVRDINITADRYINTHSKDDTTMLIDKNLIIATTVNTSVTTSGDTLIDTTGTATYKSDSVSNVQASQLSIEGPTISNEKITAAGDVSGNGHSLSFHTHTAPHGETTPAH